MVLIFTVNVIFFLWLFACILQGCENPGWLNFVWLHLTFVGLQFGHCCMSPFWHMEFEVPSRFLENFSFLAYSVSQVVNITARCRWKLRIALFWLITQWVISHRCFRTLLSVLSSRVSLGDGTNRLSWNIGKELQ